MDMSIDALTDEQLLVLCDMTMSDPEQAELSDLLAAQQDGQLSGIECDRLDELMHVYQRGLVRKSEALRVAVQRGLRPALS